MRCVPDGAPVAEASVGLEGEVVHKIVSSLHWQVEPGDALLSTTPLVVVVIDEPGSTAEDGITITAVAVPAVDAAGRCLGGMWLAWDQPMELEGTDWLGLRWLAGLLALELGLESTPFPCKGKGVSQNQVV